MTHRGIRLVLSVPAGPLLNMDSVQAHYIATFAGGVQEIQLHDFTGTIRITPELLSDAEWPED